MRDKSLYISWGISFILMVILIICLSVKSEKAADDNQTQIDYETTQALENKSDKEINIESEETIRLEIALEKIEFCTRWLFRFTEDVSINVKDSKMEVTISFVPEVGSFPIKEEIYEDVVYHALHIIRFYPEVSHLEYNVLYDDKLKEKAMTLIIDEKALSNLEKNYYGSCADRDAGFQTKFSKAFSTILETEQSKKWRERVD